MRWYQHKITFRKGDDKSYTFSGDNGNLDRCPRSQVVRDIDIFEIGLFCVQVSFARAPNSEKLVDIFDGICFVVAHCGSIVVLFGPGKGGIKILLIGGRKYAEQRNRQEVGDVHDARTRNSENQMDVVSTTSVLKRGCGVLQCFTAAR
jgi:hypothetical protein